MFHGLRLMEKTKSLNEALSAICRGDGVHQSPLQKIRMTATVLHGYCKKFRVDFKAQAETIHKIYQYCSKRHKNLTKKVAQPPLGSM